MRLAHHEEIAILNNRRGGKRECLIQAIVMDHLMLGREDFTIVHINEDDAVSIMREAYCRVAEMKIAINESRKVRLSGE